MMLSMNSICFFDELQLQMMEEMSASPITTSFHSSSLCLLLPSHPFTHTHTLTHIYLHTPSLCLSISLPAVFSPSSPDLSFILACNMFITSSLFFLALLLSGTLFPSLHLLFSHPELWIRIILACLAHILSQLSVVSLKKYHGIWWKNVVTSLRKVCTMPHVIYIRLFSTIFFLIHFISLYLLPFSYLFFIFHHHQCFSLLLSVIAFGHTLTRNEFIGTSLVCHNYLSSSSHPLSHHTLPILLLYIYFFSSLFLLYLSAPRLHVLGSTN